MQRVDVKDEIQGEWNKLLDQFTVFSHIMLLMGLVIAFALIFNTIAVNVIERGREVATMRTIGVRMKTIVRMATLENLTIGPWA